MQTYTQPLMRVCVAVFLIQGLQQDKTQWLNKWFSYRLEDEAQDIVAQACHTTAAENSELTLRILE